MKRGRKIILVSHCILNQNTVVKPLARAKGAYTKIVEEILNHEIGIHQLPCPEFIYLGLQRKPMEKEEYDTSQYRSLCKNLSKTVLQIIKEYLKNGYEILGIIGIENSPSCDINGKKGIFMEELFNLLKQSNISLKTLDIPEEYEEGKNFSTLNHNHP
ncbi:CD3072 family TudS-related putative desulfidase [Garciella nitratireducens]|uniref:CD3072 family TudS-related putative desulfidase n=1 Tax=Garciella nitratireducens TaxID=218205 RepID=UPI000DEBA599|nr:CD3072 family TudS-related putative desulfidase [Garciella nitratireducens]RBP36561.1 putative secreted protein [Garciella nitratireducens]